MTYSELIEKLFNVNLHGGVKLGLHHPRQLDEMLGTPSAKFRSIHIAGSNGKGSVATKIASGLQNEGYRVGLYTSPHISCFRERIRINGEMIPEAIVEDLLTKIFSLNVPATFFEITTALAFLHFAESQVDFAVIETGLGGRFDATNIILPELAVITSLSLEHTEILGETLDEIAHEKAGIIKKNIPVILGPKAARIASLTNSPATIIKGDFPSFREENNAIAKKAMQQIGLSPLSIEQALLSNPPCRMEVRGNFILDVAHNPDGLERIFKEIQSPIPVICALSKQKDIPGCMKIIRSYAKKIYLLNIEHHRLCSPYDLLKFAPEAEVADPKSAIAQATAENTNERILVTGSFFIMSLIRSSLGICEASDPCSLQENWGRKSPDRIK